jgi:S1-C subfamily serine protease
MLPGRHRQRAILVLGLLSLLLLACSLPSLTRTVGTTQQPTPTLVRQPTEAPPTKGIPPTPPATSPAVQYHAPANELEAQVESVYDRYAPAVVNITSRTYAYDYFMRPVPQEGTGSGFVYDADGHIVTNYHVVAGASTISVALADGEVYEAEVVGADSSTDLAVLRIEADDLPTAIPLGDSDQLRVGQFVVAIGNPFGLERTLTIGVISSLGRVIQSPDGRFIGEAIQTDAAINPGNSGGPLLNLAGEVIGVNSQIISESGSSAGIGFAVSAGTVQRVAPALISDGRYPHPWLGVEVLDLSSGLVEVLNRAGVEMDVDQGVLVVEAVRNGPAAEAGIRGGQRIVSIGNARLPVGGDIIVAVGGHAIGSRQDLNVYLESQTQVGDTAPVTVVRDGEQIEIDVTLTERPEQS